MNIKEKLHLEINKLPFVYQVMKEIQGFFVMRIPFQTVLIKDHIGELENHRKSGLQMRRRLFSSLPSWYRPLLLPDLHSAELKPFPSTHTSFLLSFRTSSLQRRQTSLCSTRWGNHFVTQPAYQPRGSQERWFSHSCLLTFLLFSSSKK